MSTPNATAKKGTRAELEQLRQFKAAHQKQITQAAITAPVIRPQATVTTKNVKLSAYARASEQERAQYLQKAMSDEAQKRGQKLSKNTYKTPRQLSAEWLSMSPQEQRVALNAAILKELLK